MDEKRITDEEAARKAAYRKALEEEVEAVETVEAVEAVVRKAYTAWLVASLASRGG